MIHQYQSNGYNIVLDVNSGAVHVVDELCYDVIACLSGQDGTHTPKTLKDGRALALLKESLGDRYIESELAEALEDVVRVLYVQALLAGGHPLRGGELRLMNQAIMALVAGGES